MDINLLINSESDSIFENVLISEIQHSVGYEARRLLYDLLRSDSIDSCEELSLSLSLQVSGMI
jgi:hypothetical protein